MIMQNVIKNRLKAEMIKDSGSFLPENARGFGDGTISLDMKIIFRLPPNA